ALPLLALALNWRAVPHPLRWAAASGVVSLFPLALWLLYRTDAAGTPFGHPPSRTSWTTSLHSTGFTLSFWLHRPWGWAPLAGILAGIAVARNARGVLRLMDRPMIRTAMISTDFIVLYVGFLIVSASLVHIETPRDRYLAPIYLPLLLLVLIAVQALSRLESPRSRTAVLLVFGIFVLGQVHLSGRRIAEGLTSD